MLKGLVILLAMAIMATTCGCASPRKLIGTNVVGADVETARDSTTGQIQADVVQRALKGMQVDAHTITKKSQDDTIVGLAKGIERDAKETTHVVAALRETLEKIHHRSLGKTYMSKTRLLMLWLTAFVVLGIAVRFVPFFQPVHRFISGVANMVMDGGSGMYEKVKDMNLGHASKSTNVDTEKLPPEVQAEMKKAEARQLWVGRAK